MAAMLAQFEGQKYLSIETYRKSGRPVRTPVWFVKADGLLYVRTAVTTGKFKRIGNNPSVKVAPCDFRGRVKGDWVSADASIAPAAETDRAYRLLRKKYGIIYALSEAFLRKKYVVLKISGKDQ